MQNKKNIRKLEVLSPWWCSHAQNNSLKRTNWIFYVSFEDGLGYIEKWEKKHTAESQVETILFLKENWNVWLLVWTIGTM